MKCPKCRREMVMREDTGMVLYQCPKLHFQKFAQPRPIPQQEMFSFRETVWQALHVGA